MEVRCALLSKPGRLFPTWEIWSEPTLLAEIASALESLGVTAVSPEILDWMRLLEGVPKFGVDIRDRELPQETGQVEALHFSKGCYLGQEIVERIRSRGNVHRIFHGFLLEARCPAPGTALLAGEKAVGELTSVAQLPGLPAIPLVWRSALATSAEKPWSCTSPSRFRLVLPSRLPFQSTSTSLRSSPGARNPTHEVA